MGNKVLSEKREYIAIDYFRFVCALLVVAIHLTPLYDLNTEVSFWFKETVCRVAVPFFFVTAGYFVADKMQDKRKMGQYLKRLIIMYALYTVLHLPVIIRRYYLVDGSLFKKSVMFLKEVFFTGTFTQFWYFAALITAIVVIYIFMNVIKLNPKRILVISGGLYVIGVCGCAYKYFFLGIPVLGEIMSAYYRFFETTRNGWFFGMFLVMAGISIRLYSGNIPKKCYWLGTLLFFGLMNVEAYIVRAVSEVGEYDITLSVAATAVFLFLTLAFVETPIKYEKGGKWLRKMSVLMFGLHLLCECGVMIMEGVSEKNLNSIMDFLVVVVITFLGSVVLVCLSKFKYFSWVKYLY